MASGRKQSWVWQYFHKLGNGSAKCKVEYCSKTYPIRTSLYRMKIHLREEHKIFNKDEERQWREREEKDQLIWRHFRKSEGYSAVCNICSMKGISTTLRNANDLNELKKHLISKHPEKLTEEQQEPVSEENDATTSSYQADTHSYVAENLEKQGQSYSAESNIYSTLFPYYSPDVERYLESIHPDVVTEERQEPVSEENDANTSSYQADTHSYVAENLEEQDIPADEWKEKSDVEIFSMQSASQSVAEAENESGQSQRTKRQSFKARDESFEEIEDDAGEFNRTSLSKKDASLRKSTEGKKSLNKSRNNTPMQNISANKSLTDNSKEGLYDAHTPTGKKLYKKKRSLNQSCSEDTDDVATESEKNISIRDDDKKNKNASLNLSADQKSKPI